MGIEEELKRNSNLLASLITVLQQVNFNLSPKLVTNTGVALPEGKKEKKSRRTNAQIAEDKRKEKKAAKNSILDLDPPVPPPAIEISLDELRSEASAVVDLDSSEDQKGLAIAQKIITDAGYKKISDIPEKVRSSVVAAFKEAVRTWKK